MKTSRNLSTSHKSQPFPPCPPTLEVDEEVGRVPILRTTFPLMRTCFNHQSDSLAPTLVLLMPLKIQICMNLCKSSLSDSRHPFPSSRIIQLISHASLEPQTLSEHEHVLVVGSGGGKKSYPLFAQRPDHRRGVISESACPVPKGSRSQ